MEDRAVNEMKYVYDGNNNLPRHLKSRITSVVMAADVTTIGRFAFFFFTALTSIDLGNTVTVIERGALACCTSLASITIPPSVIEIHADALFNCPELERQASAAGLSIEDWGRLNWFETKRKVDTRFAIVSTVKKLDRLSNDELDALVATDASSPEVGAALRFLVECGEEGLMRLVVRFVE